MHSLLLTGTWVRLTWVTLPILLIWAGLFWAMG